MRHPDEKHYCKLLRHDIFWGGCGGCYEVQEVREDNMDMELFPEPFDLDDAKKICGKCRWCNVTEKN
nr:MAG TPA: hypothetical protein [Caudoviricetes sp.]